MSLSLGIDIGTSGIRTAVVDEADAVISVARADHLPQDANRINAELWWKAVQTCIRRQIAGLEETGRSGRDISRIAIDGTSGTMVLTDADLRPVTRALMYNSKGFETEAERIAQHAPQTHITQGSGSALARAMRLVSEDRDDASCYLLHQADYVAAKLMGRGGLSDHNNALKTGFDPETERWPGWVDQVIDPDLLPKVHAVGTPLATLAPQAASGLGLSPTTTVCAGTTDSIAAFLACAPIKPGAAVTSLGSTLAIKVLGHKRIDAPEIGLYSHRLGDVWLAGGASNTGGAVLADFFTPDEIEQLSAEIDPNTSTGLDYYPLAQPGERFPINDPNLQPRLTPRPDSDALFLQGMLEGIARVEAQCYREIAARGGDYPKVLYSAGGGAKNPTFQAIRRNALGLKLSSAHQQEAAVGAARLTKMAHLSL